ncbi:MAG: LysR family transcriptional regulator [Eubacterium ventriosum]
MNNNEFTYIKEVAKQKSFSKASKALGISQPALSNYIKKLEDRMGVLLFDRSISPIEITEFGKAYLEYAEDVISATDRLNDVMSDLQDLKKEK